MNNTIDRILRIAWPGSMAFTIIAGGLSQEVYLMEAGFAGLVGYGVGMLVSHGTKNE